MEARQKIETWVAENPDGYLTSSFARIANEIGVAAGSVDWHLPEIIADRDGCLPSDVMKKRAEAGFKRAPSRGISIEQIAAIRRVDAEGTHPRDIAYSLGIHFNTVKKYTEGD